MANIAVHARPALLGLAVLTIAALPWTERSRCGCDRELAAAPTIIHLEPHELGPLTDELPNVEPPSVESPDLGALKLELPLAGLAGDIVHPPLHPDARPWPHGMVITPQPIDPGIVLFDGSPLDTLLSALVAPFKVLGT